MTDGVKCLQQIHSVPILDNNVCGVIIKLGKDIQVTKEKEKVAPS